ncbi:TolB family protein [Roseateles sp. BYS87W]|uniref:TolB family protein n=1 Tax=Pelomonas baiyunensis TaxID=3299026 RepID=A0ABW7GW05_9BURK
MFTARLNGATGQVSEVTNITPVKGANFQPSFTRDGQAVLFASDRTGSNNVYRYDLASGATTALTATPHNLYSPTPLPDGSGFSAVRVVEADPAYGIESKQPSLWRFGWDGQEIAPVVPVMRVGYHAWVDGERLALFIVDDVAERNAHRAVLFNRSTGKSTPLTDKPGRSLGRSADGRRALYVDQTDPEHWQLCAQGEGETTPQVLVETPVGPDGVKDPNRSQYFAALPDGSVLMARGALVLRWSGKPGARFEPLAELPGVNGNIRNLTASPDGKRLAFSVTLTAPKP